MAKSRDLADSANVINFLDNLASDVQAQIEGVLTDAFNSEEITTSVTLDANTKYTAGAAKAIANGTTVTIPTTSLLEVEHFYRVGRPL
jgi:hypothetical protein